VNSILYTM